MNSRIVFTLACLIVLALLTVPSVASAQCRGDLTPAEPKLTSNQFYRVISPNHIKFRPGVFFELVKAKDGKEFLRYGKMSRGKLVSVELSEIECACDCPEWDCTTTVSGGDAKCRGGCYDGSTPCTSCHFHLVALE